MGQSQGGNNSQLMMEHRNNSSSGCVPWWGVAAGLWYNSRRRRSSPANSRHVHEGGTRAPMTAGQAFLCAVCVRAGSCQHTRRIAAVIIMIKSPSRWRFPGQGGAVGRGAAAAVFGPTALP